MEYYDFKPSIYIRLDMLKTKKIKNIPSNLLLIPALRYIKDTDKTQYAPAYWTDVMEIP